MERLAQKKRLVAVRDPNPHQRAMRSACALVRYQRAVNAVSRHSLQISGQSCSGLVSISSRGCSSNSGRHPTQKSKGAIADRHSAVLTAKTPEELEEEKTSVAGVLLRS